MYTKNTHLSDKFFQYLAAVLKIWTDCKHRFSRKNRPQILKPKRKMLEQLLCRFWEQRADFISSRKKFVP